MTASAASAAADNEGEGEGEPHARARREEAMRGGAERAGISARATLAAMALALAAGALFVAELAFGPVAIPLSEIWAALTGDASQATEAILFHIRLPRALLAVAAGAGLALSGTALQGVLRNPLADPMLIGVTGGATVGAVTVIVLGRDLAGGLSPELMRWMLPGAAFIGAGLVTAFVFAVARRGGATSVATLILAGVAANAIAFAMVGALTFISDDQQLRELTFWTMGGLNNADTSAIALAGALTAIAGVGLWRMGPALDLLQLGERAAFHAGLDVERAKLAAAGWSALAVGAVTAVCGPITFIGLAAPHLARLLVGPSHARVIPAALLAGVALVLVADLAVRTAVPPAEPPIGLATGLIGGPFFLWLLLTRMRRMQGDA